MIKTDKYKKGVIAITRKAAEINPRLGHYEMHFINEHARFIVQLTNGQLEIDIDLARECEINPGKITLGKVDKALTELNKEKDYKSSQNIDSAWKRLFSNRS